MSDLKLEDNEKYKSASYSWYDFKNSMKDWSGSTEGLKTLYNYLIKNNIMPIKYNNDKMLLNTDFIYKRYVEYENIEEFLYEYKELCNEVSTIDDLNNHTFNKYAVKLAIPIKNTFKFIFIFYEERKTLDDVYKMESLK